MIHVKRTYMYHFKIEVEGGIFRERLHFGPSFPLKKQSVKISYDMFSGKPEKNILTRSHTMCNEIIWKCSHRRSYTAKKRQRMGTEVRTIEKSRTTATGQQQVERNQCSGNVLKCVKNLPDGNNQEMVSRWGSGIAPLAGTLFFQKQSLWKSILRLKKSSATFPHTHPPTLTRTHTPQSFSPHGNHHGGMGV